MDEANKKFELGGKTFVEGDVISIDGTTGNIYDGAKMCIRDSLYTESSYGKNVSISKSARCLYGII